MPYKFDTDKIPMPKSKDRRCKLSDSDRELIRSLYGTVSQRKLAKRFCVSRRLIQFVGDPSKHEANLERRRERGGSSQYYSRSYNTRAVREHRRYKQSILKSEEIKEC
jgi:hypothetical protein